LARESKLPVTPRHQGIGAFVPLRRQRRDIPNDGANKMQIKLTKVYVDDLDKALSFYTGVLGFSKKADFRNAGYRWLTVVSPDDPEGTELQLELNSNPAARAYQAALFEQNQPAANFYSSDVKAEYDRIASKGGEFTMPPTDVTASIIAQFRDTCGNLVQITQLNW